MTLRRGFRTEAERTASEVRRQLELNPADTVDIREVAALYTAEVIRADELVDIDRLRDLERVQAFAFSACTFDINDQHVIVVNPIRSPGRQNSDIAHELAHLILKHDLTELREVGGVTFLTCRSDQEEEATNLGGTILLPRPLLLKAARQAWDPEKIAQTHEVTLEMARFRFNTTGVAKQVNRSRQRVSPAT